VTDENHDSVAVAETLDATSEREGTVASAPAAPVRAGRRSILPVGTVVGRYVLAERIGTGGMGTVYRANDPKLDRDVAVKLVSSTDLEAAQQYLEREAQAMAKLSHPNVATVHDIGTWNGQLFIAMELCTGGSLATWLAEPRPWRDVVLRLVAAGRGLAAAHRIGLVHRDFKPDNVLVSSDGTIKVSDFGLVRSSAGAPSTNSNPDAIEGTPVYMAPEQLEGREVDARADQFAFAVSVWEGVCGGRPFQPEVGTRELVPGMLRAIRARRLMRSTASDVPKRVLKILERALSAEPGARWSSLDALLAELERAARPSRARWVIAGVGAVTLVAGVTATVMYVQRPSPQIPQTIQLVERGLGRVYEAAGDLASSQRRGKLALPDGDDMSIALVAYRAAFAAVGDRELRPKLARALRALRRCSEAVMELDAYLHDGGTRATISQVEGFEFRADGGSTTIDREYVVNMRKDCQLGTTELELGDLANALWRTGDYDGAAAALERAYVASDDPMYIKQIGDVRRDERKCDEARAQYERYLGLVKDTVDQGWIDTVRGFGASCNPDAP